MRRIFICLMTWGFVATAATPMGSAQPNPAVTIVLAIDVDRLRTDTLLLAADHIGSELQDADPIIDFSGPTLRGDAVRLHILKPSDSARALSIARRETILDAEFNVTQPNDGVIEIRASDAALRARASAAARQTILVLRRQLERFGSGVTVHLGESDRIVVGADASTDLESLRRTLGISGHATFHIVHESDQDETSPNLPEGMALFAPHPANSDASSAIVSTIPHLTGERLVWVRPDADPQTEAFVLNFRFDAVGTELFCQITREHVGRRFAVVLDNQVLSAPRINEPICGGRGQISGDFTAQSAMETARLLMPTALPARLKLLEERAEQQP